MQARHMQAEKTAPKICPAPETKPKLYCWVYADRIPMRKKIAKASNIQTSSTATGSFFFQIENVPLVKCFQSFRPFR